MQIKHLFPNTNPTHPIHYRTRTALVLIMLVLLLMSLGIFASNDFDAIPHIMLISCTVDLCTMAGLTTLCLVFSMDRSEPDYSTWLFFALIVINYLALLCNLLGFQMEGHPEWNGLDFAVNVLSFALTPLIGITFWYYQRHLYPEESRLSDLVEQHLLPATIIDILFILVAAYSGHLFTFDAEGYYVSGPLYGVTAIYPTLILTCCLIANMQQKIPMRKRIPLVAFSVAPMLTTFATLFFTDYSYIYVVVFLTMVILYGIVQMERSIELARKNEELMQKQTQLMISQINPHFLYNTLATIQTLCRVNPKLAGDTVQDLAGYLRGNVDVLLQTTPVSITKEMEHVQYYTNIEQLRFSDVTVRFDLQDDKFEVPSLSVQPIVENAIRHGLNDVEDGLVEVSTFYRDGFHYVVIRDNGTGFDPNALPEDDGRSHVGLANVKARLAQMVGGTMTVESTPGKGTTATICIPDRSGGWR